MDLDLRTLWALIGDDLVGHFPEGTLIRTALDENRCFVVEVTLAGDDETFAEYICETVAEVKDALLEAANDIAANDWAESDGEDDGEWSESDDGDEAVQAPRPPVGPFPTGLPTLTPYHGPGVAAPGYTAQVPVGLVPYVVPALIPKPVLTPYTAPAAVTQPAPSATPSPVQPEAALQSAAPVAQRLSDNLCAQGIEAVQGIQGLLDSALRSQVAFLFVVNSSDLSCAQLESVLSLVL